MRFYGLALCAICLCFMAVSINLATVQRGALLAQQVQAQQRIRNYRGLTPAELSVSPILYRGGGGIGSGVLLVETAGGTGGAERRCDPFATSFMSQVQPKQASRANGSRKAKAVK